MGCVTAPARCMACPRRRPTRINGSRNNTPPTIVALTSTAADVSGDCCETAIRTSRRESRCRRPSNPKTLAGLCPVLLDLHAAERDCLLRGGGVLARRLDLEEALPCRQRLLAALDLGQQERQVEV